MNKQNTKIAVIGLGYVGLPLAVEFAKKYAVIGFDIKKARVDELSKGHDATLEVENDKLQEVLLKDNPVLVDNEKKGLYVTYGLLDIQDCNTYVVTVPTPIDKNKKPDLTPLLKGSETVGNVLKKGDVVIYESTVYPGATEEDCVPVLEKASGLTFNKDFFVGYSPERINPGDKEHTVATIKKITSGSTPEIAEWVDDLYKQVITAGTHRAPSMKVAEAAKVIENAQRDINIAFVNELSALFEKMNIDTLDVLEAAGSKWNFLPFRPGLVGGHCIGVDPYYLTHKAAELGHHSEIILAGRRLNDSMGFRVAGTTVKHMIKKGHTIAGAKVLVLGITFKENTPDIRNSRVIDVVDELASYGCDVDVYDPWANPAEVREEYGIDLITDDDIVRKVHATENKEQGTKNKELKKYDAIIAAVAHKKFEELNLNDYKNGNNTVVYDIKGVLPREEVDARL